MRVKSHITHNPVLTAKSLSRKGKQRMFKKILAAAAALVMIMGITGCTAKPNAETGHGNESGNQQTVEPAKKDEKVQVTMYLWDKSMSKQLTPWLAEQFPDIDIAFVTGYNTMAYYSDLNDRGEMPDIITCRRFSINDASHLSDKLMDMSETEIVGTFYSSYIENNRETDGAIRWLPMCAEIDGYIANVDLFEENNIPLPTNYAEFIDALNRFEELGIKSFITDFHSDYTCLETMQGCAIPELMSLEGSMWRMQYESETEDGQVGLDDKVWPVVFEKYEQYIKDMKIQPEDVENEFKDSSGPFLAGELAVMRGTATDAVYARNNNDINAVMLPYFGEEEKDNWILTYPICQVAVSKSVEQDEAKKDAVMKILDAIFSEEGQRLLASGSAVLSYNKTVHMDFNDVLREVQPCIESNHMYMRLASTEIFSISKDVAQKMIKGEYGAKEAYEDFNAQLTKPASSNETEAVFTQNEGYEFRFTDRGIPSASSFINTWRSYMGDDIAIGYSNVVTAPVYTGDYSEQQLKWFIAFKTAPYQAEYTGAEVREVMEWLVNVKEDGSNPVRHKNILPVTSGMEYTVKDNSDGTFTLGDITINGQPLDESKTYKVFMIGDDDYMESLPYCKCPMPEALKEKKVSALPEKYNTFDLLLEMMKNKGQFDAPTEYVTINK